MPWRADPCDVFGTEDSGYVGEDFLLALVNIRHNHISHIGRYSISFAAPSLCTGMATSCCFRSISWFLWGRVAGPMPNHGASEAKGGGGRWLISSSCSHLRPKAELIPAWLGPVWHWSAFWDHLHIEDLCSPVVRRGLRDFLETRRTRVNYFPPTDNLAME